MLTTEFELNVDRLISAKGGNLGGTAGDRPPPTFRVGDIGYVATYIPQQFLRSVGSTL